MSIITKEWIQKKISDMEDTRDEIPFGLGEEERNMLAGLRIALTSLEAETVYQVCKEGGIWVDIDPSDVFSLKSNGEQVRILYSAPPAPALKCPFPCGWDNLNKYAIQDAAFVARGLIEGEMVTEPHRHAVIANNERLLKVIAAMLQGADGNSPAVPDDVRRMDWMVSKTVNVREPMVYGSHSLFWSQTITDEEDDYYATKLREQIDEAIAAEQAAAPQQEVK